MCLGRKPDDQIEVWILNSLNLYWKMLPACFALLHKRMPTSQHHGFQFGGSLLSPVVQYQSVFFGHSPMHRFVVVPVEDWQSHQHDGTHSQEGDGDRLVVADTGRSPIWGVGTKAEVKKDGNNKIKNRSFWKKKPFSIAQSGGPFTVVWHRLRNSRPYDKISNKYAINLQFLKVNFKIQRNNSKVKENLLIIGFQ